jgi:MFS family permease
MNSVFQGGLFKHPSFVHFWSARLIGILAHQMLMLAVSWHVYDLTSSAWDLGLVGLFQFLPALLMTLPAGHVADRYHRGKVFAACLLAQLAVSAVLWFATEQSWASRELMFGLSVVLGITRAFQMPAQQAITPLLVPTAWLQQAIAISASGMQAAIITGPALGGVLYAASPALVYAICGALSLLAALQTLRVQIDQKPSAQAADWGTVLAGVKFVWQRKVLLGGMALDLFAVLLGGATALLPMFARDILEVGPQGLGLLRAAPAVGALVMSLVVARFPLRRHVGKRLLLAVAIFGLATVVFGWSEHFWLSFAALAITGAADNISVVTRITLVQLETPDHMRGRVAAVNTLFIGASNQLGEFESGATAAWWGPVGSVVVGGLGTTLVALLWLKLFPDLAKRDRMEQPR